MPAKDLILPFDQYDCSRVLADLEAIRQVNPHRFEFELITAVCHEDQQRNICVGYRDVPLDEFWVRGHVPGNPLMPGVIMCETAAQLCSYYARKHQLVQGDIVALGGLDQVRFRGTVRPGDRLVTVARLLRHRPKLLVVCEFQQFVREQLVCEGQIRGVALTPGGSAER